MNTNKTKAIEPDPKDNDPKDGEPKEDETKELGPKDSELFFEVPVMPDTALSYLTSILKDKEGMTRHTAVTFRVEKGKLMIGVLPTEVG